MQYVLYSCTGYTLYSSIVQYVHCTVYTKEYISVIEVTAPPESSKHLPTQPLPPPALSDSQVVGVYCRQNRERLGGQMFGRGRGVLSVLLLIYILWTSPSHCPLKDPAVTHIINDRTLLRNN